MRTCPCCRQDVPIADDLQISLDENVGIWKGIVVELTPSQAVILHVLVEAGLNWTTLDKLMHALYGGGEYAGDKIVSVQFSLIRRRFRDAQIPIEIENNWHMHGGGKKYRLRYG